MPQLVDLPGVKGNLPCKHSGSISESIRLIQRRRAVTAAGSNGAINVWRDDKRKLRSEFMRFLVTLDRAEHNSIASLRRWLKEWWPRMGR